LAKKEEECPAGLPGWIVSFADLMTLLFAAFVVLYALKIEGEEPRTVEEVTSSIRKTFNDVPDEVPEDVEIMPTAEGKRVFQYFKGEQLIKPIITRFRSKDVVINVINKDLTKIKDLVKMIVSQTTNPKDTAKAITIHQEDDGIRLRLLATYFYKPGQYQIKASELSKFKKIAKLVKELGKKISIEGHSDNSGNQGRYSKWELSSLRATYLLKYMIRDLDFPSAKIKAAGYGDARPLSTNDTAKGRKMNRRVEIKISYH